MLIHDWSNFVENTNFDQIGNSRIGRLEDGGKNASESGIIVKGTRVSLDVTRLKFSVIEPKCRETVNSKLLQHFNTLVKIIYEL